jgi:UDP-sugar transporter A1/2/3
MQNIRLALLGIPISAVSLFLDRNLIAKGRSPLLQCLSSHLDGMWRGWDTLVVVMTVTNSIGGLLIAVVMKYADNILKAYAQVLCHVFPSFKF